MRPLVAAVAIALLLTGCAPQSPPTTEVPTMTLEESKQQLLDIFDAAVAVAGGEWDLKTDREPSTCAIASGEDREKNSEVS
jgi:hypothetical protein